MECPSCQTTVPEGSKFCMECGTPLPRACPACGHSILTAAKFCPECGAKMTASAAPAPTAPSRSAFSAERRHLTVLFCDLVGSTALASRLDPEDLRDIITAYHRCVAEVVRRLDGFVAKYMGDGVLVYFGYPQAHEDDAERAVQAGLALVEAFGQLPTPEHLQVRIGIGTGLVVVGDLVGSGDAQERGVVGETPNLAARLQAMAEPNTVVIGPWTRRLLGALFEYRDLGPVAVKGYAEPVQAYQVLRPSTVESRFEARRPASGEAPLVGREEEAEFLLRRWQQAKSGEGRVALLSGEPGIGKSCLAAAVQERLQNEPHIRLRYFCSVHHTDSALHPTIAQLERAAGFEREDTPETKLDKLTAMLAPASPPQEDGVLLAELLSLPTEGRFLPLQLTPRRKKEKTLEALLRQLDGLARQSPVLMLFEDVHWIDPSSRELLDLAVERVQRLRVLLVVTFRPEFEPPWTGQAHVTLLALNRLDRHEGAALVRRVVGNRMLPSDVVEEIAERTDGVPLFIEELTKAVLEAGSGSTGAALSRVASTVLTVPATLHASLMARLDRLGPAAKEVAQVGAVIGREFAYELLAAVAQTNETKLRAALDQLVAAGLVFCRGTPPHATFLFKHALVQDAAYSTLLRGKRQELHAQVVRVLEEQLPEAAEAQPELLAHHCARAGLLERAIDYYARAGQRAVARSAMAEAVAQLAKGLELLASLPDDALHQRQELELQVARGRALIAAQGYPAPAVGETYARARALCEQLGRPPQIVPVLYGQYVHHLLRGPLRLARDFAAEMLQLGEEGGDVVVTATGHRACGTAGFHLGDLSAARVHLEQALARFDPAHRPSYDSLAVQDARVTVLSYLSLDLFCLGSLDHARLRNEAAVKEAHDLRHTYSLVHALTQTCWVDWALRSREELQARADAVIAVSAEQGFPYNLAVGTIFRGWALARSGQDAEGIALLQDGLAAFRATGAVQFVPFFLVLLADAQGRAKQPDQGLGHAAEAERLLAETEDRWAEAELHRVRGELLCAGQDVAGAERCYCQAVGVARRQGARFWELRAAISLARLWRDQGKPEEARDLLAPIHGWFTEGFDTPDLIEANAVLG